ncbi:MAG: ferrous iron transport protein A [Candidatus Methanomethylophilaceae archaeon]|jgi:ferrous iron transport protein A|nr:ferrous iron transport protein A [Thermoplasmata archaeon]MBO4349253.1 ferrous iron transport protein A [Candidatus Methanomethylophilaceae archaeon]MBR2092649.1 ferrous iron transport protein A [Candidatus Methanomethylophilaceae archaeon]MBR3410732.1 ferrous iron transport protein A [Candidatus Methanomethylophilaceae archaeon]MBR3475992.1 ferrous iron transport protein A [Candidatus Methanomethylophilaceae archaeon]
MKTLKEAAIGSTVKVIKIHGEGALKRHIMDMGITKGCSIYVRKVAPLGDPVEITLRGYELSLRKEYAEMVEVE